MSTLTNKIKNIFGTSNNTAYTSTGANITTSNSTTGTININTSGANTGILTGASTTTIGITNTSPSPSTIWGGIVGGVNNTISSSVSYQDTYDVSLGDSKLSHIYKDGEQFFQHEILVTRIYRDKDNRIKKSETISQYWIGSPSKEKIEYKNLSTEDRPEVELVIRTLRTIQL